MNSFFPSWSDCLVSWLLTFSAADDADCFADGTVSTKKWVTFSETKLIFFSSSLSSRLGFGGRKTVFDWQNCSFIFFAAFWTRTASSWDSIANDLLSRLKDTCRFVDCPSSDTWQESANLKRYASSISQWSFAATSFDVAMEKYEAMGFALFAERVSVKWVLWKWISVFRHKKFDEFSSTPNRSRMKSTYMIDLTRRGWTNRIIARWQSFISIMLALRYRGSWTDRFFAECVVFGIQIAISILPTGQSILIRFVFTAFVRSLFLPNVES